MPRRGALVVSAAAAPDRAHTVLVDLYRTAVEAASPGRAVLAALDALPPHPATRPARVHLLALGKAAHPMAAAATAVLVGRGAVPAGGVVIAPNAAPPPHPHVVVAVGSHPVPDLHSANAAARLADAVARVAPGDEVWVLLSGGASSLAGAPVAGVSAAALATLSELLLGAGLDVATMNAVRKRFSRWSGGRLAVALAERQVTRVRCLVLSDVIGDDLAAIGSGPCIADPITAADVAARLRDARLWHALPASMQGVLAAAVRDAALETPKAGDPAFDRVETTIVASNQRSLDAVVARARELGLDARIESAALDGEASRVGQALGAAVRTLGEAGPAPAARCLLWGGETTVTLGETSGLGGRCQELALAAAAELSGATSGRRAALLAAGTDGRDGPTDAAGAIVDATTWAAVRAAGRDPGHDLSSHDAYRALDAAGALVRPGLTGTNVMDVMIGISM